MMVRRLEVKLRQRFALMDAAIADCPGRVVNGVRRRFENVVFRE
jgi:hypothetical protein